MEHWERKGDCGITFVDCANVTKAAVEAAFGDLLDVAKIAQDDEFPDVDSGDTFTIGPNTLKFIADIRRLNIHFHFSVCPQLLVLLSNIIVNSLILQLFDTVPVIGRKRALSACKSTNNDEPDDEKCAVKRWRGN